MNGHIENKWARVPKAWEDPGHTPNEEGQVLASYEVNKDTDTRTLSKSEEEEEEEEEEEINKEEDTVSVNPPVSRKQMTQVSDTEQTMPFPQFVDTLKNLLEVAPTVLHGEEQEMEVEWAEARDECLRVMEEGLATLQCDVTKSLVNILDSLDRGQRLRRRARDAERRSEKERRRKSCTETEKWTKRWAGNWEGGKRTRGEGWSCEKKEDEEDEVISGMCLEVRRQVQMAMDKAESEREEEVTESDSTAAKQELAVMEVLMDQLGAVEDTCRRHCKTMQDRMARLWETIEKNRLGRVEKSDQCPSSVTPLAILEPCLVRGRRPLLPPITSLNEEGGKCSAIQTGTEAPTQGITWHMEPMAENHRAKKKKRKKKVEMKEGEEEEVDERNGESENVAKSWKQRLTEWLHAPLCGCAVRCY
ncbi:hypothetical protein SKAU_G00391990 [Synaphobranchus kaupii]|uniref:Uncharacterized protein n=1 Tax=Synaphobranchus kaupii TaxID=118154 RepID=A0A9Q1EBR3_SYNKA|nr:hypothetical protein SKAU_G00391990 [Synaphobranchus kaupii]